MKHPLSDEALARIVELKTSGVSSFHPEGFLQDPMPHQRVGAEMAYIAKRLLLMDSTGLGKTYQALMLVAQVRADYRAGKRKSAVQVIAVESGLMLQWKHEVIKTLGLDPIILEGTPKAREKKYQDIRNMGDAVVLLSHAKLRTDVATLVELRPDTIVVDEAAVMANKNQVSKCLTAIAKKCSYALLLTAEPISRGDIVQIRNCLLTIGVTLCSSEKEYVEKYAIVKKRWFWISSRFGKMRKEVATPVGVSDVEGFKQLIFYHALRRPEKVLGDKRVWSKQVITSEMTPLQQTRYDEIRNNVLSANGEMTQVESITLAVYLSQVLCSPWVVDPEAPMESPKADALVALLRKLATDKLIVFAKWKRMHSLLEVKLREAGIGALFYSGDLSPEDRHAAATRFESDPEVQVLVMTEAGQKGLNLQFCKNLCVMDLLYTPSAMRQLFGRIDRINQKSLILTLYLLVMGGSSEMKVMKVLYDRQSVVDQVFDENKADIFDAKYSPERYLLEMENA